jgi:signal transduction histidine kinase
MRAASGQNEERPEATRAAPQDANRRGRPTDAALTREVARGREALRAAEAALARSRKLAAVGEMASGVAHDFNNLLTLIAGNLDIIEQHEATDERIRRAVAAIAGAVNRGARLAGDLMALGRHRPQHAETVRLDEVLTEFATMAERVLGDRVRLSIVGDAALWPCRIDRAQFESAVLNLALNARDAMPRGGNLRFTFRNVVEVGAGESTPALPPGRYVSVLAADTGTGMGAPVAARATEAFFTTKPPGSGSGLGLSQVREFVEQSGGALNIASRPGKGTRITMLFPAAGKGDATGV